MIYDFDFTMIPSLISYGIVLVKKNNFFRRNYYYYGERRTLDTCVLDLRVKNVFYLSLLNKMTLVALL